MLNPEKTFCGPLLIGLYSARAFLTMLDSYIAGKSAKTLLNMANTLVVAPKPPEYLMNLCHETKEIKMDSLINNTKAVINFLKNKNNDEIDNLLQKKVSRLKELIHQLNSNNFCEKFITIGGKILATGTNIASGITITVSGQDADISRYLTLISSGIDAAVNMSNIHASNGKIVFRYLATAELLFLNDSMSNYILQQCLA
jgi:hypothetical protein